MYSYLTHQSELYADVLTLSAVGSLYGCNISVTTQIRALVQVIVIYVCSLSDLFPCWSVIRLHVFIQGLVQHYIHSH